MYPKNIIIPDPPVTLVGLQGIAFDDVRNICFIPAGEEAEIYTEGSTIIFTNESKGGAVVFWKDPHAKPLALFGEPAFELFEHLGGDRIDLEAPETPDPNEENPALNRYKQIVNDAMQSIYMDLRNGAAFENVMLALASRIALADGTDPPETESMHDALKMTLSTFWAYLEAEGYGIYDERKQPAFEPDYPRVEKPDDLIAAFVETTP